MADSAADVHARILAEHPEAVVVERGRYHIKHRLADGPDGRQRYVLDCWLPPIAGRAPDVVDKQVDYDKDDAMRRYVASYFRTGAYSCEAGALSGVTYRSCSGFRFRTVAIPQGATIGTAYLTLRAYESKSNAGCNTKIRAEDVDSAAAFSTEANWDSRFPSGCTTAEVEWDGIDAWTGGEDYDSPEIKTVIQEIVSRGGWASNQNIVIFWDDYDNRSSAGGLRIAEGWDHDPDNTAKLHIEYSVGEDATITATTATAVAAAPLPTITTVKNVAVSAVVATATAAALLASVITAVDVEIAGEEATAVAAAPTPSVSTGATVTATVAIAIADALTPTVAAIQNVTIAGEAAAATATAPTPTVAAIQNVEIAGEIAAAIAAAPSPTVSISKAIAAAVATATADALNPTIATTAVVQVSAAVATAVAAAPTPTIVGVEITITAVTATAVAAAPLPSILHDKTLSAVTATAVAAALLPTFTDTVYAQYGKIIAAIDPDDYPSSTTLKLLVVLWTNNAAKTVYARLYNVTDDVEEVESVVNTDSESPVEVLSSALSLPSGAKTYRIDVGGVGGGTYYCSKAIVRGTV